MVAGIPLDWVEEITSEVLAIEKAPLLPPAPPFPEKILQDELLKNLGLETEITVGTTTAIESSSLKEYLSPTTTRLFSFSFSPYSHPIYAAASHEGLTKLASWLLAGDMAAAVSLQSAFQESFYLFIAAAALDSLQATGYFKNQALRLLNTATDMKEMSACLMQPIKVSHKNEEISFSIFISQALQKEIKKAALQKEQELINQSVVASKIHLSARLLVDQVQVPLQEIASLQEGSFLLLNKEEILTEPASVQIMVGKRAFFAGHIKKNTLTITALAEPVEEIKKMDSPSSPEKKAPAGQTPSLPPKPGMTPQAPAKPGVNPEVPPPPSAQVPPQEGAKPTPPKAPEDPKYFLGEDEEFFVEDEELSKVLEEEQKKAPASAKSEPAAATATKPLATETHEETNPTKLSDIPLHVEVVIGYMRLPVKDLLSMQVGGTYTLANSISSEVDLLINGKRIAKGELLKCGDTLGVRIISL